MKNHWSRNLSPCLQPLSPFFSILRSCTISQSPLLTQGSVVIDLHNSYSFGPLETVDRAEQGCRSSYKCFNSKWELHPWSEEGKLSCALLRLQSVGLKYSTLLPRQRKSALNVMLFGAWQVNQKVQLSSSWIGLFRHLFIHPLAYSTRQILLTEKYPNQFNFLLWWNKLLSVTMLNRSWIGNNSGSAV